MNFRVTSFVPNDGCLNFIDENDGMTISFCFWGMEANLGRGFDCWVWKEREG